MERALTLHAALDYRLILKEELDSRCAQNPRYSLRAFARDLKLAPSRLSEILNKKQGLSRKAAERIADILGYGGEERDYFCDLVDSLHARSKSEKEVARIRLMKYRREAEEFFQLRVDTFKIISDWYHLGILELINLDGFRDEPRWIARTLRITPVQAELAVERLIRVGLLERKGERLAATTGTGWIQSEIPSESIRKFHRQILQKAGDALATQTLAEREFTANVLTINRKDLTEAKNEIRRFQQRFCQNLKNQKNTDSLYCLAIQFFNLAERCQNESPADQQET